MSFDPTDRPVRELLAVWGAVMNELRRQGVIRTNNNPIGDLAEALVAANFGGQRGNFSQAGWDVKLDDGTKLQVKALRLTAVSNRQNLSPVRAVAAENEPDAVVVVVFNEDFSLNECLWIDKATVDLLPVNKHVNGRIIRLNDQLRSLPGVRVVELSDQLLDPSTEDGSTGAGLRPSPPPGLSSVAGSEQKLRGCLLGGAVGDALGAGIEFASIEQIRGRFGPDGVVGMTEAYGRVGAITDDTQMTMFTAEGLIRAYLRGWSKGISSFEDVVDHAYARWLLTQGTRPARWADWWEASGTPNGDGWLVAVEALHERRAPGNTCLAAMASDQYGTIEEPINDSKGCGGVMRMAPAGLITLGPVDVAEIMDRGSRLAALTHGHPSGYLSAGALAAIIHAIVWHDRPLDAALDGTEQLLEIEERGGEVLGSLRAARQLANEGPAPSPEVVAQLGQGWVAEEALAIAVYCARVAPDFRTGVLLAVNHSGDSDSTGAIAGNILGAIHGEQAMPPQWLQQLELRQEITRLATDWTELLNTGDQIDWDGYGGDLPSDQWWRRYPGW
jgi:ADP-ribosylglycohydrolase